MFVYGLSPLPNREWKKFPPDFFGCVPGTSVAVDVDGVDEEGLDVEDLEDV